MPALIDFYEQDDDNFFSLLDPLEELNDHVEDGLLQTVHHMCAAISCLAQRILSLNRHNLGLKIDFIYICVFCDFHFLLR